MSLWYSRGGVRPREVLPCACLALALILASGVCVPGEDQPQGKRHEYRGDVDLAAPPDAKPAMRDWGAAAGGSFEHVASFDGLDHRPQIVAVLLGEPDVGLDRSAIQPLRRGNRLGALGKRLR